MANFASDGALHRGWESVSLESPRLDRTDTARDQYEEFIQVPQFVGTNIGSKYDWKLSTEPQTYLDGATRPLPLGKVLGGGSILNAMCWNRGGIDDYDSWEALGNPGWNWDGLLPYFIKVMPKLSSRDSTNNDRARHTRRLTRMTSRSASPSIMTRRCTASAVLSRSAIQSTSTIRLVGSIESFLLLR